MSNHVFNEWKDYRQKVMPPVVSDIQKIETKRAFYSGALCLLKIMVVTHGQQGAEAVNETVQEVWQELMEFTENVEKGLE